MFAFGILGSKYASNLQILWITLRKICPNTEVFLISIFMIRTQYGEAPSVSPYSVRIRENTDQKKTPLLDTFHAVQHCQGNREEDGLSQYL